MKPWMIVLASAIGAIVVAAALVVPEMAQAPRSGVGPILVVHWPALAVAALAMYGLCVMLLTTTILTAAILRLRRHLAHTARDRAPTWQDCAAAFTADRFRQLSPLLALLPAQSKEADGAVLLQTRPCAREARSEIARLHYISLARSHFFSALIILAGIFSLGAARDYGMLPFQFGAIPTASAIVIIAGLVFLAILGRIAIDVTAEPLFEILLQLPAERVETRLLRRAVELLESTCRGDSAHDKTPASPAQLPELIVASVEQGHRLLLEAVSRLSANVEALETVMRTSVETLESTIRASDAQRRPMHDNKVNDASALPQLQAAVEDLTAVLQRLSAVPDPEETTPSADQISPRAPAPRLARELRKLLQEINAG
jgi:hypothetical protein